MAGVFPGEPEGVLCGLEDWVVEPVAEPPLVKGQLAMFYNSEPSRGMTLYATPSIQPSTSAVRRSVSGREGWRNCGRVPC